KLSPDGTRIAALVFHPDDQTKDIWIYDLRSGQKNRLTYSSGGYYDPVWSPAGNAIAFGWEVKGVSDLYLKKAGAASEELLFSSSIMKFPTDWSRDGQHLLFEVTTPKTNRDVWMYSVPERKAVPFLE